jgi:hypothetical protein
MAAIIIVMIPMIVFSDELLITDIEIKEIRTANVVKDFKFYFKGARQLNITTGQHYISPQSKIFNSSKLLCETGGASFGRRVYRIPDGYLDIEHSCGSLGCSFVLLIKKDLSKSSCSFK